MTLALFQQLRGAESEHSFLRDVGRFFAHLFPGTVGLVPSSLPRRSRKPRRFLEPLRRSILPELVGDPETLIVDSMLLEVSRFRASSGCSASGRRCPSKTLVGLVTRIAAKLTAYTYAFLVNHLMGLSQGRIKELWA